MATDAQAVFLIGMMGAGKSTIGRLLASQLQFEFVDADRELEARSGVPIPTIFEIEGEAGFRKREAALLDELTQRPRIVLATGGGAILDPGTRDLLKQRGLVIYLRASIDEILRRTRHDRSRPLLRTADPRARIDELLAQREPLYTATADLVFQSAASNPRRLVARLIEHPQVRRVAMSAP
jgi:shikimate kinase